MTWRNDPEVLALTVRHRQEYATMQAHHFRERQEMMERHDDETAQVVPAAKARWDARLVDLEVTLIPFGCRKPITVQARAVPKDGGWLLTIADRFGSRVALVRAGKRGHVGQLRDARILSVREVEP